MIDFLKSHLHPLGGRIIFWNLVLLIVVKVVLPQSNIQFASLIDSIPVFDSRDIIRFTNETRTVNNLPPLSANSKLDLAASDKLLDMATKEYFAHVSPSGVEPWYWIKKSGYNYTVAGENLAIGFFTAKETVQAWLESPSHKDNLLNSKYREIGVATKAVEINNQEGILVVQMFGTAPSQPIVRPISVVTSPAPSSSPSVSSLPAVSPLALTRGESTLGDVPVIQYVTTDLEIEPVTAPKPIRFDDVKEAKKISDLLNNMFSIYFLIIAGTSALAFVLLERNRGMAVKMTLNMALFILSVVIPAAEFTFEGLIF